MRELAQWIAAGRLKYRETVAEGLEQAPRAAIANILAAVVEIFIVLPPKLMVSQLRG